MKLREHVKRKIVKQTVMTSVYGVTFIGARKQIRRQLKDLKLFTNEEEAIGSRFFLAECRLLFGEIDAGLDCELV